MPRHVPVMPREQLERLPTKAVLGRLVRLRECEQSPETSDLEADELTEVVPIRFKSDPQWTAAWNDVKAVLATRTNLPSRTGAESRAQASRRPPKLEVAGRATEPTPPWNEHTVCEPATAPHHPQ